MTKAERDWRIDSIVYRVDEWAAPPFWRPFAFRRWQTAARAELARLVALPCEEVSHDD